MNLLTLITFLPLVGIAPLFLLKEAKQIRTYAAVVCFAEMILSIMLWWGFDAANAKALGSSPLAVNASWIKVGSFDIRYAMDVDGISVLLVLLTGILGFIACLSGWGIQKNVRGFFAMYFLLLTGMMGTFVATDLFLFYVFWELMLLPMYFLIGLWGGPKREFAAIKFFIYTLVGSVLMLGAFLAIYFQTKSFFILAISFSRVMSCITATTPVASPPPSLMALSVSLKTPSLPLRRIRCSRTRRSLRLLDLRMSRISETKVGSARTWSIGLRWISARSSPSTFPAASLAISTSSNPSVTSTASLIE